MKVVKIALASLILYLLSVGPLLAQERNCSYLIVHINGVSTDYVDAYANVVALQNLIGSTHNGKEVKYALAHNPTRARGLVDLAETLFSQKLSEYPTVAVVDVVRAFLMGVVGDLVPLSDQERLGLDALNYIVNTIKEWLTNVSDSDLVSIVNDIRNSRLASEAILLVPHSQGNLYANLAYEKLTQGENAIPTESIKIFGIANAASSVAGGGQHFTSSNDVVLQLLRLVFPAAAATDPLAHSPDDNWQQHSMVNTYLSPALSGRETIRAKILTALSGLVPPPPAMDLVGTWMGTWIGRSMGRSNAGEPASTAPVSGSWLLVVQSVNIESGTAAGTLSWSGQDAFWTYTFDPSGRIITSATPQVFIPNRTIAFDASNSIVRVSPPGGTCTIFTVAIEGFANALNPSDAFYGPRLAAEFDTASRRADAHGNGFLAHPYNPENFDHALSNGDVVGSKLQ